GRIIGKGTYGSVDIVENRVTKQLYARKRCQLSPDNLSGLKPFQREVKIMKMVAHRHVVRLVSAYVQDSCLNIVMSPLAQGTLRQYLDLPTMPQGSAPRIRSWVGCLSSALSYLHANRIRHADIKPQNLLVKESDVYISDFGISRIVSEPDSTSSSISPMTPMYAAPEIAQHQPHGRKADVFSLGCVVFEMLT
ncbi:kinase-like protein, partial [Lophium mytilinum]